MARKPRSPRHAGSGLYCIASNLPRFQRLADSVARRVRMHPDDVMSIFVCNAESIAARFDPTRGVPFDKYLSSMLALKARQEATKERRRRSLLHSVEQTDCYTHQGFEDAEFSEALKIVQDSLSSTQWWLLRLRSEGASLEELAALMRVSRNTIKTRLDEITAKARKALEE